jgi:cytochrome c-type biogenesis protein CcmH
LRAALLPVLLALALAPVALASEAHPTQAELEGELVCPTCETTLDQSNAPVAQRMKAFIARRIAAGDTKSEIKDKLVAQFGKGVLAAPEREGFDLLAWVLPIAALAAGAVGLSFLLWRWTRRPEEELPLLE